MNLLKSILTPYTAHLKLAAYATVLVVTFYSGWHIKSMQIDAKNSAILEAKAAFIDSYRIAEAKQAATLENTLATLKANEKVIYHETQKIVTRNVYKRECIDDDGVQLIESARAGKADTAKPAN
jgi:hypothetical protein